MESLLRVDMTTQTVALESLPRDMERLGGRALTSAWVGAHVPPGAHPLGPRNVLVIAPGLLGGTVAANSGRLSIGAKSPLTGGIKESNVGGTPATRLARCGIRAIVIEGQPESDGLHVLRINAGGATIEPADNLRGLGNYAVVERLANSGGRKVSVLSIGPAGEMRLPAASVAATSTNGTPSRHAGRGGMGAVMGSKGIKAIVIEDPGSSRQVIHDKERLRSAAKSWRDIVNDHVITEALREFGTPNTAGPINEVGAYPTRNFSDGRFEGVERINGPAVHDMIKRRGGKVTHAGCTGCTIQCSNEFVDEDGAYVTSAFEYETIALCGANCGIDDLDSLARMDYALDDIGIDSMETGCAIAVAMEAGVRRFGDATGALELIEEVRLGTPLGRIIGSGASVVGRTFGVSRVPAVKGQSMAAYDPRSLLGQGVGYATSPMGADHTACFAPAQSVFGVAEYVDPLNPEGQVEYARALQIDAAMLDALGLCQFVSFPLADSPEPGMQALAEMASARSGLDFTPGDLKELGREVLRTELAFNRLAGLGPESDRLPDFFSHEELPPHGVVFPISAEALDSVLRF